MTQMMVFVKSVEGVLKTTASALVSLSMPWNLIISLKDFGPASIHNLECIVTCGVL